MLHTKFRGNRPSGSGDDFRGVFTIYEYGRSGHLGNVTQMPRTNFRSPNTKFGLDWPNGFREAV